MTFGDWLGSVVGRHELVVDALGSRRRVGTWSERLSFAMGEGEEYDSYLRRVARSEVTPRSPATYKIGRGLRAAGLLWCSGTLALMRNPRSFKDMLAVIDIASRDEKARPFVLSWYLIADRAMLELPGSGPHDDEYAVHALKTLAVFARAVDSVMESAFTEYEKRGLRDAHGLLGIAYHIAKSERSGPRATDAINMLTARWIDEIPSESEGFVARIARLSDAASEFAQDRFGKTVLTDARPEKA